MNDDVQDDGELIWLPNLSEERAQLNAVGSVNRRGKFEILAITAGEGNGWQFTESALQDSLPLWDGISVFVDHGEYTGSRSVKDLGGTCRAPRWDGESQGVLVDLQTAGPSGPLIDELGREWLASEDRPPVGFSADVIFKANGKKVEKILRVLDLSLVFNPARGGAFKRALNSLGMYKKHDTPLI